MCFGFSCRWQQKCHVATLPPTAVRRRMKRKRQKLVGRDKGSLTKQQTKGNSNNNDTDKEKTQQRTARPHRPSLPHRTGAAPSRAASEFPPPSSPPLEPSMTAHGMEYPALFGQVGSAHPGCAPSWIPVKISPVLAKPRTSFYSQNVGIIPHQWASKTAVSTLIIYNLFFSYFYYLHWPATGKFLSLLLPCSHA